MRLVPWFTLAALVVAAISPLGRDVLHSSFFSGEHIARTLGLFFLTVILAIAAGAALLEWAVRYYLHKRRNRQVAGG